MKVIIIAEAWIAGKLWQKLEYPDGSTAWVQKK